MKRDNSPDRLQATAAGEYANLYLTPIATAVQLALLLMQQEAARLAANR